MKKTNEMIIQTEIWNVTRRATDVYPTQSDDQLHASPEQAGSSSTDPWSTGSSWQHVHEWREPNLLSSADDPAMAKKKA